MNTNDMTLEQKLELLAALDKDKEILAAREAERKREEELKKEFEATIAVGKDELREVRALHVAEMDARRVENEAHKERLAAIDAKRNAIIAKYTAQGIPANLLSIRGRSAS